MNYEVTISEYAINEMSGKMTAKKCLYMVNSLSFGEAEKIAVSDLEKREVIGVIKAISESNVCFVDEFTDDYLFKVKIVTEEEEESTGKLKKTWYYELLSANTPEDAIKKAREKYAVEYGNEYSIDQSCKTIFINILNY